MLICIYSVHSALNEQGGNSLKLMYNYTFY